MSAVTQCSYSRVAAELQPVWTTRTLHIVRIPKSAIIAAKGRRNVNVDCKIAVLRRLDR